MELRSLRYFVAVAEELHFGRAARRLNISQPPLSYQIRQLEREIGVQLLARTTRRVELTPAGNVFLDRARCALDEADRAVAAARRAGRGEFETLRLSFAEAAVTVLPGAVQRYRTRFPHVHLELTEHTGAAAQIEAVERGVVDLALGRGPVAHAAIKVQNLLDEPFYALLPEAHPLAQRAKVALKNTRGHPVALFPRRLAPSYYDLIISMCQRAGFTPDVAYEVEKYATTLSLVASGSAISFVPRSSANLRLTGVSFRPLTGTDARAQVVVIHRHDRASPTLQVFLSALGAAARGLTRVGVPTAGKVGNSLSKVG